MTCTWEFMKINRNIEHVLDIDNLLVLITFVLYKYKMKCRVKNESMSEKTLRQRLKCELFTENAVLRNINKIKYYIY